MIRNVVRLMASLSQGGRLFSPITDSLPCLRCAFYELKVRFIVNVHSYVDIFGVKAIEPSGILEGGARNMDRR